MYNTKAKYNPAPIAATASRASINFTQNGIERAFRKFRCEQQLAALPREDAQRPTVSMRLALCFE
jgi:hypothetical protein